MVLIVQFIPAIISAILGQKAKGDAINQATAAKASSSLGQSIAGIGGGNQQQGALESIDLNTLLGQVQQKEQSNFLGDFL